MTPTRNNVEPTTSVIDELRAMLDERGVEHVDEKNGKFLLVTWCHNKTSATFVEDTVSGETSIAISAIVTPEQAIAATLGRGTCHLEINTSMTAVVCDRCNYPMPRGTVLTEVHFCPNCGRKVVDA